MRNPCKSMLALWVIGMCLGVSAPAQAATGVGPYYATPSWDQTFPAATRFIVLTNMASEAVLDRETGLVWEQSPSTSAFGWVAASAYCTRLLKGGRKGWRLPGIQELASLIDPTVASYPKLPPGHPFGNVLTSGNAGYWSATTNLSGYTVPDERAVWGVDFLYGHIEYGGWGKWPVFVWCVRGGQGTDAQ